MYDKELSDKIISVSCTFEELEAFVINIDKKEFDIDNAFEKYYDAERILYVIRRYENKEISDKYLAYWMDAYNWIIMAGFRTEQENKEIVFKNWLVWKISDWLDSLSFFDDSEDYITLGDYKNSFLIMDKIYKSIDEWKCVFAHTDEFGDNEDDVVLLAVNNKTKEFVKIYGNLDYLKEEVKIEKIEADELKKEVEQLKKQGFNELKYGAVEETEESMKS